MDSGKGYFASAKLWIAAPIHRLAMTMGAVLLESTLTMDTKQLHYTSQRPYRQKSIYL
ncbi:hypothetical protein [Helicobacter canis]|uniref:hypothetical protein n=1 Tax=Helicobacter canis TaxID=29419 RepID=UPI0015F0FE5B|nr:hypothetical protein [Helicobacter canis]